MGCHSKRELQRHLSDPAITSATNLAKSARVDLAERTARLRRELSVIERIEKFCAKLESRPFADTSALVQGEVPIVYSGTVKETPVCITRDAEVLGTKRVGREELMVR